MEKLISFANIKKGNIVKEVEHLKMAGGNTKEAVKYLDVVKSTKYKIFVVENKTGKLSIISKLIDLNKLNNSYYLV